VFTIARGASGAPLLRTDEIPWNRDDLTRDIESFREKLARRDLSYREAGGRLYRRLLAPFGSELRRARLLVIAPDGPLWNLPFQALIDGNGRYLIETHAVFYAPSLTWLRGQSRLAVPSGSHRLLAMGDPDTAAAPDTARQVQELARFYGAANSKVLLGADASRTNWQQEAPNFRILHLATHAIFNSANPMYSYLVFSGKTDSDKVLEARDVLKMNLHSDLVVLSACETGRGRVSMGEGLVGMTWAFLLAGARTTVVSQWKADSASTTQLMIAMHGFLAPALADGPMYGRARSLQKAALAVMRTPEYSHPFYWAGFVMVGNGY
jgi:CHAT domain-containing protein